MMRWNSAKTYTEEDMLRMQQEAMDRVREFQQRTRTATGLDGPAGLPPPEPMLQEEALALEPAADDEAPQPASPTGAPQTAGHQPTPQQPLEGVLERLGLDGETALILGVLLLLYNENADHLLLLALAYLLF